MLRIVVSILIAIFSSSHALAFSKTARAQNQLTLAEVMAARDTAKRFAARLRETSDFAILIKEFCVKDCFQRHIARQKKLVEERTSSSDEFFLFPGIWCDAALFDRATTDDWQRFYVAAYNFLYVTAGALLEGKIGPEGDLDLASDFDSDEFLPQEVIDLFKQHPILEDSFLIRTVDELRDVTTNMEKAANIMRTKREKWLTAATENQKKSLQLLYDLIDRTVFVPSIESEGEIWGYPKGTQIVRIQTALMFDLLLIKEGEDYRVLFVELHIDD